MKRAIAVLALASLFAAAARADEERLRRNIEVVFDTSGSMEEDDKIGSAKRALEAFLGTVPADTNVGLVVFADGTPKSVIPLGPLDRRKVGLVLDLLEARGPTPIADSLELAAAILRQQRERQGGYGSHTIVVVTDGEETVRRQALPDVVESIVREGMLIDVIGFGLEEDHSLKSMVTRYRSAGDEAELTQAILDTLAETESYEEGSRFQAAEPGERPERRPVPNRNRPRTNPAKQAVATACGTCSGLFVLAIFGGALFVLTRKRR